MRLSGTPSQNDTDGFVLAGGASSRMGTNKALALFNGEPLVAHALSILQEAGLKGSIAGSRVPLEAYAPVLQDKGLGPLGGICAGLAAASGELAAFLSVDLPLLPASLVAFAIDHARFTNAAVTLAAVNGFAQTFPAIVHRSALPVLQAELRKSNGGCFAAFQSAARVTGKPFTVLPVEVLAQAGQVTHHEGLPPSLWFLNVNRPVDLIRAEVILRAHHRVS